MIKVTLDDIVRIFEEIVDLSDARIESSAVLGEDIPVDSKEMLRILSRIESKYRFRFVPGEVIRLKTLGHVLETVRRRANEA